MPLQKTASPVLRLRRTLPAPDPSRPLPALAGLRGTLLVPHGREGTEIEVLPLSLPQSAAPPSYLPRILKGRGAPLAAWGLSRDGRELAILDALGTLQITDAASGKTRHRVTVALTPGKTAIEVGNSLSRLALSPDGRFVAIETPDKPCHIADVRSGKIVFSPPGASAALFSPDGKALVTGGMWWLRTWTVGSWKKGREANLGDASTRPVAWAPDGKTIFTVTEWYKTQRSGVPQVRRDSLKEQAAFGERGGDISFGTVTDAALSPDGRLLAVAVGGFADGTLPTLELWDTHTRKAVPVPPITALTASVQFSPDGRFLVTVHRDATRLWEVTPTGRG